MKTSWFTRTLIDPAGFAQVNPQEVAPRRHVVALEAIAGAALAVSIVVAVTAVSIGIARADTLAQWHRDGGSLSVGVWTVMVLTGLSGLSGLITWLVPSARRALRTD